MYFKLIDEIQDRIHEAIQNCEHGTARELEDLLEWVRMNWNR